MSDSATLSELLTQAYAFESVITFKVIILRKERPTAPRSIPKSSSSSQRKTP
jgi:hypothetical protein